MSTASQERTIAAEPADVWRIVADPHQMPRWWPGVVRVEDVQDDRFTQVFKTRRGRSVRADFRVVVSEPTWRRAWEQELEGTPFERVLEESLTEIMLAPVAAGTRVTLAERQKPRGYSRTGAFFVHRAATRRLEQALAGLDGAASSAG